MLTGIKVSEPAAGYGKDVTAPVRHRVPLCPVFRGRMAFVYPWGSSRRCWANVGEAGNGRAHWKKNIGKRWIFRSFGRVEMCAG